MRSHGLIEEEPQLNLFNPADVTRDIENSEDQTEILKMEVQTLFQNDQVAAQDDKNIKALEFTKFSFSGY